MKKKIVCQFFVTVAKALTETTSRRRACFVWGRFIMARRAWQSCADHIMTAVNRDRECTLSGFLFCTTSLLLGPHPTRWCCPHSGLVFLPYVILCANILTDAPELCSTNLLGASQLNQG
jgi:hypothetical protein